MSASTLEKERSRSVLRSAGMSWAQASAAGLSRWDWVRAEFGRVFSWGLVWLFTLTSVIVNGLDCA